MIRLAFRGFSGHTLVFQENREVEEHDLENVLPGIARRHSRKMRRYPNVTIEIEFLDEPDVTKRFFRLGNTPMRMTKRFFRLGNTPMRMTKPFAIDMTASDELKREALERWKKGG